MGNFVLIIYSYVPDIMFMGCPSVRPSHFKGAICVQRPAKAMPFQQSIMHALQCQHDVDVHLLFFLTVTSI